MTVEHDTAGNDVTQAHIDKLRAHLDAIVTEAQTPRACLLDGAHVSANLGYAKLFGFADAASLQKVPFLDLVAAESRHAVRDALAMAVRGGQPARVAFTAQLADDTQQYMTLRIAAPAVDDPQQLQIQVGRGVDKSTRTDCLAGRASLRRALQAQNAYGTAGQTAAALSVCLDDLRNAEQQLGMAGCDTLLIDFGLLLVEHLQSAEQCFRVDYGEYVLLLHDAGPSQLEDRAHSLCTAIQQAEFTVAEELVCVTASIGLAVFDAHNPREQRVLVASNKAHQTTSLGGNRVVVAAIDSAQPASPHEADAHWLDRIRNALESDGFTLAFQAIASLEGDTRQHRDVLLRMSDDLGNTILPGQFLPTAAKNGLMPDIDRWVIRQAFKLVRDNQARDENPQLFIKISAATLKDKNIAGWLADLVDKTGVNPANLLFSYSQDALLDNLNSAAKLIKQQQKLGFDICISEMDPGQQSLELLSRVDADFVKLSPAFNRALIDNPDDAILTEVIRHFKQAKVKVIAARVEDANSMAQLWTAGVQYIQGYYVDDPTG